MPAKAPGPGAATLAGRLRRAAVLIALGLAIALGQAPWGAWFLTLPALAVALTMIAAAPTPRAAFGRAWLVGAAQFALALSWIVEPFLVDIATHGWMAPFALTGMAGGLALFWAVPGFLGHAALRGRVGRLWAIALGVLAFEALRGGLFTGFPWALIGHIWIGTPVDQLAAYGGALGLSALALGVSAAMATAALRWRQSRRVRAGLVLGAALMVLAVTWVFGTARLLQPPAASPDIRIRLVQANVPQHLKWQRDLIPGFFQRHLDLSAAPSDGPLDLVVWPESAVPVLLENPGQALVMAGQAAGVPVVLGLDRSEMTPSGARRYFNALAYIDAGGDPLAVYDKHHLVPFGEYFPVLGTLTEAWGGLASQVLTGYTAGPGPAILDLGDAGRVLPLICYEVVFPRNLRTGTRPDYVLQITNDAWFGTRTGPYQHLAQARLRAIEFGLPVVRAANTGVSAVIDARGRITHSLPLGEMGTLDAPVPGARAATFYARTGDAPWFGALSLVVLFLLWRGWKRRKFVDAGVQPR